MVFYILLKDCKNIVKSIVTILIFITCHPDSCTFGYTYVEVQVLVYINVDTSLSNLV